MEQTGGNAITRFLDWWLRELASVLTPRRASARPWRTLVRHSPDGLEIAARSGAAIKMLGTLEPGAPTDRITAMKQRLSQTGTGTDVLLRLSPSDVVARTIQIPSAASDVIEPVLRNQLERIVPWPQSDTCYGYQNLGPATATPGQLDIEIVATTQSIINSALGRARNLGLSPYAVDFASEPLAEDVGVTLMSLTPHPVDTTARSLRNGLAGLCVLSIVICAFGLYQAWERQVTSYEISAKIAFAQARVAQVTQLNNDNAKLRGQRERLVLRKREEPAMMMLIEALSRALPDSAYLTELEIHGREVRLTGKSDDPTTLITTLEETPQFKDVHFSAPTTRQEGDSAGTFSIVARAQGNANPSTSP